MSDTAIVSGGSVAVLLDHFEKVDEQRRSHGPGAREEWVGLCDRAVDLGVTCVHRSGRGHAGEIEGRYRREGHSRPPEGRPRTGSCSPPARPAATARGSPRCDRLGWTSPAPPWSCSSPPTPGRSPGRPRWAWRRPRRSWFLSGRPGARRRFGAGDRGWSRQSQAAHAAAQRESGPTSQIDGLI